MSLRKGQRGDRTGRPRRDRETGEGGGEEKVRCAVASCSWPIHAGAAHVEGGGSAPTCGDPLAPARR